MEEFQSSTQLEQEPKQLKARLECLDDDLDAIALENCDIFITNRNCVQDATQHISESVQLAKVVQASLPRVMGSFKTFEETGNRLLAQYSAFQTALRNHREVTELLEMPQLVNSCQHSGLYGEALDVAHYAENLLKHFENLHRDEKVAVEAVNLVESLVVDVRKSVEDLRTRLLQQLTQRLSLPTCLKLVGHLRRLYSQQAGRKASSVAEIERLLQDEFLAARTGVVTRELRAIGARGSFQQTLRVVDVVRENWIDTISQFHALFGEEGVTRCREWVFDRMEEFVTFLKRSISSITDHSRLYTLLDQCTFCGQSLARVGADLRACISEEFVVQLIRISQDQLAASTQRFAIWLERELKLWPVKDFDSLRTSSPPSNDGEDCVPHPCLISFPSLAQYTNSLLVLLNDVRCVLPLFVYDVCRSQCPLVAAAVPIGNLLEEHLRRAASSISAVAEKAKSRGTRKSDNQRRLMQLSLLFQEELCPLVCTAFHRLFSLSFGLVWNCKSVDTILMESGLVPKPIDSKEAPTAGIE